MPAPPGFHPERARFVHPHSLQAALAEAVARMEDNNTLTAHMHRKRLSAFLQMGYELVKDDPNGVFKWG